MANLLSPGVYIEEVDASAIVPNVSANIAFLAGNFNSGPVEQPYVVTTKKEYEDKFGYPTEDNYNEWFQGYKFFDYANQLIVSRGFETFPDALTSPIDAPTKVYDLAAPLTIGGTNVGGVAGNQVSALIDETFGYKVQIGDFVNFGTASQPELGNIVKIWYLDNSGVTPLDTKIQIDVEMLTTPSIGLGDLVLGDPIFLHSDAHSNGGTQAYERGLVTNNIPDSANAAIPSLNVDGNTDSADTETSMENDNRLSYSYDLIKNDGDFDYKYDQNELQTFMTNMKLKFFSRNPNDETIEIAIANSYDFISIDTENNNYAVAFEEVSGTNIENTYLKSLYEYAPLDDEVAISVKRGSTIETFTVSMDPLSVDGNGKNNYVETVLNENSSLIYVVDNTAISDLPASYLVVDRFGWLNGDNNLATRVEANLGTPTKVLTVKGGRDPQLSFGAIRDAYFTLEDKERYEIDVVIGNEEYPNIAIELADSRKDCLAYIGAQYSTTVGKKAIDATNLLINYFSGGTLTRSMFGAYFANYFRVYDKYNKKYRWINCAGDMAGIRCDVTSNTAPWWVSAGMKRGIVRNINKLAFTPSQAQRDNLYKTGMNPIVAFPGTGNLVWGNKTLHPIASSFDRINVRTLFNTIERSMAKAARSQVFEFNDPYTRNAIMSMFNPYLSSIKAGRGITDYLVICDETNNTPDVVSRNELKVDIYIKPNYAAEMILLTFTNVGTRSFSDVVGI